MKIARVKYNREILTVRVSPDRFYKLSVGADGSFTETGESCSSADAEFLPPVLPSKVCCIGKNYFAHAKEFDGDVPEEPLLFLKPSTSVIGHMEDIVYPSFATRVDYEGELGVVIGKTCKNVKEEDALRFVLGYTCVNDVTERDIQFKDGQWTRGKGFDTFCPLGPVIETELDPRDLAVETRVNGEVRQKSRTSLMIFSVAKIIAHISACMTLLPGDVIATGTPEGVGPVHSGDTVEVEIEGIGILRNRIRG